MEPTSCVLQIHSRSPPPVYQTIRHASLPPSLRPHPSFFLGMVRDGGGDLERKKMDFCVSSSSVFSSALILSPQAVRCSEAHGYMATIRRAESQHLVLPNLQQLTPHTQPGGTSSITLTGQCRVNKDRGLLPDLPEYSLQFPRQCALNSVKGPDPRSHRGLFRRKTKMLEKSPRSTEYTTLFTPPFKRLGPLHFSHDLTIFQSQGVCSKNSKY